MKKSKIQKEVYNVSHADLIQILGLNHSVQKITDISASHSATRNWDLTISVETTETTELEVPSHKR